MKLVLSRKGFDASSGGNASPILPDATLVSLPIPSPTSPLTYDDVWLGDQSLGPLVEDLTRGRIRAGNGAHLDPDLRECAHDRRPGWRPLFGQDGTAQGHLRNAGVGVGDLFLFFGWFRQVERTATAYRFLRGAPDLHVVFGWLQIAIIVMVEDPPAQSRAGPGTIRISTEIWRRTTPCTYPARIFSCPECLEVPTEKAPSSATTTGCA